MRILRQCDVCGDIEGKPSIELGNDPDFICGPVVRCRKCKRVACPSCLGEWCCAMDEYESGE